jgi:hypothetical protein
VRNPQAYLALRFLSGYVTHRIDTWIRIMRCRIDSGDAQQHSMCGNQMLRCCVAVAGDVRSMPDMPGI